MAKKITKRKRGRPTGPKYEIKELENRINSFWYDVVKKNKWQPTKLQLINYLDISRDTYNTWKKKGHIFSDTLKKVECLIEAHLVENLLTQNNVAGVIFYLKNAFGYRDRQDIDHTSGGKPIPILGGITQKNDNKKK